MADAEQRHHWYGSVVSTKMQKTVIVEIKRSIIHRMYKKVLKRITRLKAHDENSVCKVGDRVKLIETRPISKQKHWRVVQVMEKGQVEK